MMGEVKVIRRHPIWSREVKLKTQRLTLKSRLMSLLSGYSSNNPSSAEISQYKTRDQIEPAFGLHGLYINISELQGLNASC